MTETSNGGYFALVQAQSSVNISIYATKEVYLSTYVEITDLEVIGYKKDGGVPGFLFITILFSLVPYVRKRRPR